MTPDEKLASVEKQLAECVREEIDVIVCPYCGGENRRENKALCCREFAKATEAVLTRMELEHQKDQLARIIEKAARN